MSKRQRLGLLVFFVGTIIYFQPEVQADSAIYWVSLIISWIGSFLFIPDNENE